MQNPSGLECVHCWEEAESCLAGAHHNQEVLDRIRGKYEVSTRRLCWLLAKETRGIGPGGPWTALPSLHVPCIQTPSQGWFCYTHTTCGLPMVEKSFQPCKTRQTQKESRGEEGFTWVPPGRWRARLNPKPGVLFTQLREKHNLCLSQTKVSAHQWLMIFQYCSPWLSLALIFILFSQLVPCLHVRWKY